MINSHSFNTFIQIFGHFSTCDAVFSRISSLQHRSSFLLTVFFFRANTLWCWHRYNSYPQNMNISLSNFPAESLQWRNLRKLVSTANWCILHCSQMQTFHKKLWGIYCNNESYSRSVNRDDIVTIFEDIKYWEVLIKLRLTEFQFIFHHEYTSDYREMTSHFHLLCR